jgi:hypothetical protein
MIKYNVHIQLDIQRRFTGVGLLILNSGSLKKSWFTTEEMEQVVESVQPR